MSEGAAPTFRVGLAMAGAVSAGAYTAGVLDFLFEALDAWHEAKASGAAVPRHAVSLDVASGASAGAMCATLLALALPYDFPHVRLDAQRRAGANAGDNPLYRAWVQDVDLRPMLDVADLAGGELPALLNSAVVERALARALQYRAPRRERPYVARPFVTRYTVGNLRGVPYDVSYRGYRSSSDTVYAHDDYLGFLVGDGAAPPGTGDHLRVAELAADGDQAWQRLGDAALASGAFPIFLKPRRLSRSGGDYDARRFDNPAGGEPLRVPPPWPDGQAPDPYEFTAVDGGMFNNEPLDLAREVLAANDPRTALADGRATTGAVMMIAPFVARPGAGSHVPPGPPHRLLLPLLFSFIAQCRFRPADIALAHDRAVYNRYLVAPEGSNSPDAAQYWITGGPMQGFFGFMHEEYRKHDWQLGRRNCQRFLRRHFRLPRTNPAVAQGYAGLDLEPWLDERDELPIIPLLGSANEEEPLCEWPAGVFQPEDVMQAVARRTDAVWRYYREQLAAEAGGGVARWLTRAYLQVGWWAGRKQVLGSLRGNIAAALRAQCL